MLTADDFTAFVAQVHSPDLGDRTPFPWQRALLDRILAEGRWPDVIDVPTGLGKTSVLDVAVFVAALRPQLARRRVFFVVDRRLVVDEAHEHATRLATALRDATSGVCAQVAQALRMPGDDGEVLTVARMRGGVTWDRIWVERPDRYAIVTGTVDQVGSRLLFRGYGVSEHARSIDAALVATDSLIVIDEAHLADAFQTTITAASALDPWPLTPAPAVVTMSATTPTTQEQSGGAWVHRISAADEEHPAAGRRLRARKRLCLLTVPTSRAKAATDVPRAMATLASRLACNATVVGVVANTVARARGIFGHLAGGPVEVILLTGRSRPIDRDILLARHYERIKAGRNRADPRPLIVVATQTIEVGANIDLDALITESAPLSALIQRLGRLNRLGLYDDPAPAYIVHDASVTDDDPVYGPARLATWQWLTTQTPSGTVAKPEAAGNGLDASPATLRTLAASAPTETGAGTMVTVPVLASATLDAWSRTSPTPHPDPPIPPFLHGLTDHAPPVTVIWRTGLPNDEPQRWPAIIDLLPPATEEAIDIPLRELRRWLLQDPDTEPVADIEVPETDTDKRRATGKPLPLRNAGEERRVLRYHHRGDTEIATAGHIQPGDTIVVPVEYGGCDQYGWNPASTHTAIDVADLAYRRGKPVLRIGPHLRHLATYATGANPAPTTSPDTSPEAPPWAAPFNELLALATSKTGQTQPDTYREALTALAAVLDHGEPLRRTLTGLQGRITATPTQQTEPATGTSWTPAFPVILAATNTSGADDDSEIGSSTTAYPRRKISLDAHQRAVAARAAQFATNLGLAPYLTASVEAAGRWHDEGKRDLRFQTMLFAGRRGAAELAPEPLAKSGLDPTNRAEAIRAREAAEYPPGMRHEALSARIARHRLTHTPDLDADLVVHLIASHHGRNRPLLPPVTDPEPIKINIPGLPALNTADTIDWAAPARFSRLNCQYGRWGLALLEAIVRLADIWCSARDEEKP
ncbi:type I-U CRISPR-associated helicase/endonuclease Cas3 [Micromonospora sp. CNB394]|uniref:type I-G CRISPR-associated helicase/endonuclease Cas3g n=1 Tax=Micromonospora sp. CNB394 TaxID=1169151 RepID=UPI00036F7AC0|nr:type I-U CRISPR-associated helicase/endonuclease Cas3 [Micromonospora sp. CNB394]